jgi:predicted DNA-binding transcriptional regulator AlpA
MSDLKTGDTLMRRRECARRANVHLTTWWRWEKQGLVPRARRVSPKVSGIPESEFLQWLGSRPRVTP